MSYVYRRPPQAQYRQKRLMTPTLFGGISLEPPIGNDTLYKTRGLTSEVDKDAGKNITAIMLRDG